MAHRIKKISVLITIAFSILLSFSLANAVDNPLPEPDKLGLPFENTETGKATLPIVLIIKETIKYIGLLAILVVSWGGITFLTSMGNDEKVKHAKHTIIYALV